MSPRDFWSRRRAGVEAEADAEARIEQAHEIAAREEALADRSDEEILAELDLPDPESLGEGDDFKVFLTDQIPARIKTRALRHLWRANPVLACVDGLVDYGEDFTDAATVIEGMQTAYQVGKGMTKHVEELARQAEQEAQEVKGASEPLAESGQVDGQVDGESNGPSIAAETAVKDDQYDVRDTETAIQQAAATDPAQSPTQSIDAPQPRVIADPAQAEQSAVTGPRRMRFFFDDAQEWV